MRVVSLEVRSPGICRLQGYFSVGMCDNFEIEHVRGIEAFVRWKEIDVRWERLRVAASHLVLGFGDNKRAEASLRRSNRLGQTPSALLMVLVAVVILVWLYFRLVY